MTRYILIDTNSGYVWYQTEAKNPVDACQKCDAEFLPGEDFSYRRTDKHDAAASFLVYEAPADFPAIRDGRSQSEIEAVERDCWFITAIVTTHWR